MALKKFIFKTFITIVLPVICFLCLYEYLYRRIPNAYKLKDKYLSQHAADLEVLILGSSHTFFGIDPSCLDRPAFNAANVSQDFRHDRFIFDKYLPRFSHLKYLILPVSYFSLWGHMEKGSEDWRIRKYKLYMGANEYPFYNLRYNFEFSQLGDRSVLLYYSGLKTDLCNCTSLGMGTSYALATRLANWKESGKVAANRHTHFGIIDSLECENRMKRNMQDIESIISECKNHGISVLLVTMPSYSSYYQNLNSCQLKKMYAVLNDLSVNKGITYVNLLTDNRFGENDFYDADHLNEFGAQKMAKILNGYLN